MTGGALPKTAVLQIPSLPTLQIPPTAERETGNHSNQIRLKQRNKQIKTNQTRKMKNKYRRGRELARKGVRGK